MPWGRPTCLLQAGGRWKTITKLCLRRPMGSYQALGFQGGPQRKGNERMIRIPDEGGCKALMERYAMLPNIVEHSYRVCQLAVFLGRALNGAGGNLDRDLLVASALLHDITKTRSIRTRENHAETARDLVHELGYPEVAEIVGRHIRLEPWELAEPLSHALVVNYADKRVRHTRVVSLGERFDDLAARYGVTPASRDRLDKLREGLFLLEARIFDRLRVSPADLDAFNDLAVFDLGNTPARLACRLGSPSPGRLPG